MISYTTAVEQISNRKLASVYLLFGEERYLFRDLEERIIAALLVDDERETGLTILDCDPSLDRLLNLVETAPFFSSKHVIVLRSTTFFRFKKGGSQTEEEKTGDSDDQEKLLRIISTIPEYCHLLFLADEKVDKRKKLYKYVEKQGVVVELASIKAKDARSWIVTHLAGMNKKMTADAIEHLLAIVSIMPQVSLSFLANELDKAALISGNHPLITKADLIATLAQVPEASVFVMLEALSQKQTAKAVTLLRNQLVAGDYPFRLLALLARQVRMLWHSKILSEQGLGPAEIANELKVPPFVGEKLLRQSRNFSSEVLQVSLLQLAAADRDLKSGRADAGVLEQFVIELCI